MASLSRSYDQPILLTANFIYVKYINIFIITFLLSNQNHRKISQYRLHRLIVRDHALNQYRLIVQGHAAVQLANIGYLYEAV